VRRSARGRRTAAGTSRRRSSRSPELVGEGKTNKEIAAQLYLSPKTIEYHLANAYRKLGVHSRVELARHLTG